LWVVSGRKSIAQESGDRRCTGVEGALRKMTDATGMIASGIRWGSWRRWFRSALARYAELEKFESLTRAIRERKRVVHFFVSEAWKTVSTVVQRGVASVHIVTCIICGLCAQSVLGTSSTGHRTRRATLRS